MKKTLSKIIAVMLSSLLIASFTACKNSNSSSGKTDSVSSDSSVSSGDSSAVKDTISLNLVIDNLGEKTNMTIKASGDTLFDALNENNLIGGSVGTYGFFVTSVNGITADGSDGTYWMFKDGNGEYFATGVDTTPVSDGETINIVREKS